MVYKHHQKWRDEHPVDSSVWDICDLSREEKKQVNNMRKSKPIIPYTLEIECTSYWAALKGSFLGILLGS